MAKDDRWFCPTCLIKCAIEINRLPENIVKCRCNHSYDKCNYCETVSETKKRLKKLNIDDHHGYFVDD